MAFPETLVLGATGRIGRLLYHCWNMPERVQWQARRPQQGKGWQIFAPLQDPEALARAARGRQILCLAGVAPGCGRDLAENWHLAEAAIRAAEPGSRVLLTSSAAVYGNQAGRLQETGPLCPTSAYGVAKVEMESRAAPLAAKRNVQICSLRIGNIAGLDAILGGWQPGFTLDSFPDHRSPVRSYIGPTTLARVLTELLAQPELPPVLNLAQPGVVEMATLLDAAGRDYSLRPAPTAAIAEVELDISRLQSLLPAETLPPADPVELATEWSMLEPHMKQEG